MSEALPAFQFYRETKFKEVELNGQKVRIPEEWEVVELGKVISIRRRKKHTHDINEVAVIPMDKIPQDSKLFAEFEVVPVENVKSSTYCEAGDLLVAKITPSFENGKQAIVPFDIPNGFALATTEVYPLVPEENLDVFFLFYLLKYKRFRKILEVRMTGTTGRQRVQKKDLLGLQIPLPPLHEQKKIAEVLRSIDEAIQAVEESFEKLERLKKGAMEQLLTKGIGHIKFKTVELNGRKVEIPGEWKIERLENVVEIHDKKRVPLNELQRSQRKGSYPYCGATGIIDYIDDYIFDGEYILLAEDGGYYGPFEQSAYIMTGKFWANNHVHVLQAIPEKADNWFLMYLLNYMDLRPFIVGSTRTKLNQSDLRRIPILLPPLPEQKQIAEILRTIDEAIEAKRQKKEKLERMKKAVMEKLLTGKVRVK